MALGGVPYYWRMLRRGMSPALDFDELFFSPHGRLKDEFDELYASLFKTRPKRALARQFRAFARTLRAPP